MCVIGQFENKDPPAPQIEGLKQIIKCGVQDGKIASDYKVKTPREYDTASKNPGIRLYNEIKKLPNFST